MERQELIIECDSNTQYKIEERLDGLWSGGPEICIAHFLDGKRSRTNPSIPYPTDEPILCSLAFRQVG